MQLRVITWPMKKSGKLAILSVSIVTLAVVFMPLLFGCGTEHHNSITPPSDTSTYSSIKEYSNKFAVISQDNIRVSLTLGENDTDCFLRMAAVAPYKIRTLLLELYFSAFDPLTQEFFYERYMYRLPFLTSKIVQIPLTDFIQVKDLRHGIEGGTKLYYVQYTSLCKVVIYQVTTYSNDKPECCGIKAQLVWSLCSRGPDKEYMQPRVGTWTFPEGY